MRALVPLSLLVLVALLPVPASSGACTPTPLGPACVGYTVLSTDCRVGAVTVNGVVIPGWLAIGEVTWEICVSGFIVHGRSIEAFSIAWYDYTINGDRTCEIAGGPASVETDCAWGPPHLPILI